MIEDTTHGLDLCVLYVDDFLADHVRDTGGIFFVLEIGAVGLARNQEGLAHIDGILVVRNHLVVEKRNSVVVVDFGGHAHEHGAVHRVDTLGKLSDCSTGLVADECFRALRIWELEVFESGCSARLIVGTGRFVSVGNRGLVLGIERSAVGIDELDSTRHELMDVAEVKEILCEYVGVWDSKERMVVCESLVRKEFEPVPRELSIEKLTLEIIIFGVIQRNLVRV